MGKGSGRCSGYVLSEQSGFVAPQRPEDVQQMIPLEGFLDQAGWEYLFSSWAGDLHLLSPQMQQAIAEAAPKIHNRLYAKNQLVSGNCAKYCAALATELHRAGLPWVKMVGGLYSPEITPGTSIKQIHQLIDEGELPDEIFDYGSHTWLEIEGHLVDPTASQFLDPQAFGDLPGQPEWSYEHYFPSQQNSSGQFDAEWEGPRGAVWPTPIYSPHGIAHRGSSDDPLWTGGYCAEYALALVQSDPALQLGVSGAVDLRADWDPHSGDPQPLEAVNHVFAHDSEYAYDALGRHPLPYRMPWLDGYEPEEEAEIFGLDQQGLLEVLEEQWVHPHGPSAQGGWQPDLVMVDVAGKLIRSHQ